MKFSFLGLMALIGAAYVSWMTGVGGTVLSDNTAAESEQQIAIAAGILSPTEETTPAAFTEGEKTFENAVVEVTEGQVDANILALAAHARSLQSGEEGSRQAPEKALEAEAAKSLQKQKSIVDFSGSEGAGL